MIACNLTQYLNARPPIDVTLSGILTYCNSVEELNVSKPILVTFVPIRTSFKLFCGITFGIFVLVNSPITSSSYLVSFISVNTVNVVNVIGSGSGSGSGSGPGSGSGSGSFVKNYTSIIVTPGFP